MILTDRDLNRSTYRTYTFGRVINAAVFTKVKRLAI